MNGHNKCGRAVHVMHFPAMSLPFAAVQSTQTRGVTLEMACAMLALPKELGPNPATGKQSS